MNGAEVEEVEGAEDHDVEQEKNGAKRRLIRLGVGQQQLNREQHRSFLRDIDKETLVVLGD